MVINTIGFTQKTARQFFGALEASGAKRLLDVRRNNTSQLAGFSKKDDLAYLLERMLGVEYLWLESLAPSDEDIKAYRKTGDRQTFRRRYLETLERRSAIAGLDRTLFDDDVVLLCSEADATHCHRSIAAELIAAKVVPGAEIRHL